jgi:hypothetical protein
LRNTEIVLSARIERTIANEKVRPVFFKEDNFVIEAP